MSEAKGPELHWGMLQAEDPASIHAIFISNADLQKFTKRHHQYAYLALRAFNKLHHASHLAQTEQEGESPLAMLVQNEYDTELHREVPKISAAALAEILPKVSDGTIKIKGIGESAIAMLSQLVEELQSPGVETQ